LFEADGVLILCDNQEITGHSSIVEALKPYMKVEYFKLTTEPIAFLSTKRDIAFTRTSWSAWIKVEDGAIMMVKGESNTIVQRQADGTWLLILDHPNSADH